MSEQLEEFDFFEKKNHRKKLNSSYGDDWRRTEKD
jgi:hypothetical protein